MDYLGYGRGVRVHQPASHLSTLDRAAGVLAFLDFEQSSTEGGAVSSLPDRTGAYTLSQPAAARRPVFGEPSPTGLRGATFDGIDDYLFADAIAETVDSSQPYSWLMVKRSNATSGARNLWSFGSTLNSTNYVQHWENSNAARYTRYDGTTSSSANAVAGSTSIVVLTGVYTGSGYYQWENGAVDIADNTAGQTPVCNRIAIGSRIVSGNPGTYYDGTIWCLLIANVAWSARHRVFLERAAKARWGV